MNDWLVPLSVVRQTDVAQVGGKAAGLGELLAAGFPVPPGLCVTTAVFHTATAPYKREIERLCQFIDVGEVETAAAASEKILTLLQDMIVPELENNFQSPISSLQSLLAIRSSATAEDRGDASFAGQYVTILGVRGETAVAEAIRTCWLSFFSPHALFDRARHGALSLDEGMAVLIQPMIVAECAGVCLTVDPIQERDDVLVVNAAWGLGVGVVDGTVPTDSYWVQRHNLTVERQRIVKKGEMMGMVRGEEQEVRGDTSHSPLSPLSITDERQRAACLPEVWLQRVAEFGLAVEQVNGRPQDIEWAIADGRFWLLQSRPLTGLPEAMKSAPHFPVEWQDEAERRYFWRLTEHCEGPEPPLPLEHDFIDLRESMREETCRYRGADRHEAWRMWHGRSYWRRIPLGMTDADMALRQQVFADLHDRLQAIGWTSWDYWGPELERMTAQLRARLREFDRETADGPTLADHLAQAQAVVRYCMAIHPRILFRPREHYFAAFTAVSGLTGAEAETVAYQLLDGEASKLTQLIDGLYDLAQVAKREPVITKLLTEMPDDILARLSALPEAAEFRPKLADLLAEYGERMGHGYGSEMTVLTPTWHEEPERVLALVRAYLAMDEAPALVRKRLRRARDKQVAEMCAACGDETAAVEFQSQLAYARKSMVGLENHNHLMEQVANGQLRLAIMAAARWLVVQGVLADVDDVFWLTFAEIETALRGEARDLQAHIEQRAAEWEQWVQLIPPPILGLPEAVLPPRPPFTDEVNVGEDGEDRNGRLTGLGASPGVAEGPACVMLKGYLLPELEPGTILVAQNAGPLWTPYFPQLGGLVLEEGSLGQHAAATAREYGIPAVINCRRATQMIKDGEWVRLDGATGAVEIGS